jgi:hypothetical protein
MHMSCLHAYVYMYANMYKYAYIRRRCLYASRYAIKEARLASNEKAKLASKGEVGLK